MPVARRLITAAAAATLLLGPVGGESAAPAASHDAPPSRKKAIWGPAFRGGKSVFPVYRELGVGIYETAVDWATAAPTPPADATNPDDPAYRWPVAVDRAVAEARRYRIRVAIMLTSAPAWANGGRPPNWAPVDPADYAAFATAAARRWPGVHLWLIWGEPSKAKNFMPLQPERRGRALTPEQADAPHRYARILDAAYAALKAVSGANLVIGGDTFTTGDISPRNFIRNLRLPDGTPPRMDLYGHNPFTLREPDLKQSPLPDGLADFSDLDTLVQWIDRYLTRPGRHAKLKLFLSEFTLPTDHRNREFNFYVSRATQAAWLRRALAIARGWRRIYTLGWHSLYDDEPNAAGDEVNRGLLDFRGRRKPSFFAFKRG